MEEEIIHTIINLEPPSELVEFDTGGDSNADSKSQRLQTLEQKYGNLLIDHKKLMMELKDEKEKWTSTNERYKYLEGYFKEYIKVKKLASMDPPEIVETQENCTQTFEVNDCENCQQARYPMKCISLKDFLKYQENGSYIMKSESFETINKLIEEIKEKVDKNSPNSDKLEVVYFNKKIFAFFLEI